jgi:hypothetical protein
VEQLRDRVVQNVETAEQARRDSAYREEVLDLLVASAAIDYPEILVEREIDRMVDRESNHAAHTREDLDRWLQAVGRTEEEVRESLRAQADIAVRRALVLGDLADLEEVTVPDEEISAEIDRMAGQFNIQVNAEDGEDGGEEQQNAIRAIFDTEDTRSTLHNQLLTSKTLDRLAEIASAPEEEGEAGRTRGSRRRRGARSTEDGGDDASEDTTESEAGTLEEDATQAEAGEPEAVQAEGAEPANSDDGGDAPASDNETTQPEAE